MSVPGTQLRSPAHVLFKLALQGSQKKLCLKEGLFQTLDNIRGYTENYDSIVFKYRQMLRTPNMSVNCFESLYNTVVFLLCNLKAL